MFYTRKEQTLRVGYWCESSHHDKSLPVLILNSSLDERDWYAPGRRLLPRGPHNIPILAQIISGFISFGALHIKTPTFEPWQWYAPSRY
jgi:hypothetical protein